MTRLLVILAMFVPVLATAGELSREECVDAYGRGQDAKEQGKLTLAKKLFLSCAQAGCPVLVANDCARFADDLVRQQSSVSLTARDASGADLPDTTVYIDDVLVASRLDDGRPHEVDPGKHIIRFKNAGHEQIVTIVIGSGEQGRTVAASFGGAPTLSTPHVTSVPLAVAHDVHPRGSRALIVGGVVVTAVGVTLGIFELTRVPSACSISTNHCAAAPGDQVFADAQQSVHLANLGWMVTGLGLAAAIGGTVWYVTGAHAEVLPAGPRYALAPWASPNGGGLALGGAW
jgi:hypothetical protein